MQMEYKPNQNGPSKFFRECIDIQNQLDELGAGASATNKHLKNLARSAFLKSGHDMMRIAGVQERWEVTKKTLFADFQEHYDKELHNLWEFGNRGASNELAQQAAAMKAELATVKEDMALLTRNNDALVLDNEKLKAAYAHLAEKESNNRSTGVSTITTTTKAIDDIVDKRVQEALANNGKRNTTNKRTTESGGSTKGGSMKDLQKNASSKGGSTTGNTKPLGWRQYSKYCFSRGVNLKCNGSDCKKYWCRPKDNHDATCTFEQREAKNGSKNMDDRWMCWLDPENNLRDPDDGPFANGN